MTEQAHEILGSLTGRRAERARLEPLVGTIMSPMHLGAENDLWRVRFADGEEAVLRVLRADMEADFDADAMIAGARAAAGAEAGPAVLAHDVGHRALLLEYLGGGWRTATMWDFYDANTRRGILAAMRRLHRASAVGHGFDALARLKDAIARAEQAGTPLPGDCGWLADAALQIGEAVAARPATAVPCRNDGASSNVMLHEDGRVLLLDYDQAGMNDPAYDLGTLIAEGSVFEDEAMAWLEDVELPDRRPLLFRAQLYGALDDLLWAVRAACHAHVSQRIQVEFRKYSEWRFMRARRLLADRRFEWMVRIVREG